MSRRLHYPTVFLSRLKNYLKNCVTHNILSTATCLTQNIIHLLRILSKKYSVFCHAQKIIQLCVSRSKPLKILSKYTCHAKKIIQLRVSRSKDYPTVRTGIILMWSICEFYCLKRRCILKRRYRFSTPRFSTPCAPTPQPAPRSVWARTVLIN